MAANGRCEAGHVALRRLQGSGVVPVSQSKKKRWTFGYFQFFFDLGEGKGEYGATGKGGVGFLLKISEGGAKCPPRKRKGRFASWFAKRKGCSSLLRLVFFLEKQEQSAKNNLRIQKSTSFSRTGSRISPF